VNTPDGVVDVVGFPMAVVVAASGWLGAADWIWPGA
jgi:hypothetical protein